MHLALLAATLWLLGLSALAERRSALYAGPPEWWSWSAQWRNRASRRMRGRSPWPQAVTKLFCKERRTHLALV